MKNLKTTIALFLSLFILSCSKNNDDITPITTYEYFPNKIESTFPSSPSSNGSTIIEYDAKNRISKLKYENSDATITHVLTYNSDNLISSIVQTRTAPTGDQIVSASYTYTNKILSKITLIDLDDTIITTVSYEASTNTYTLNNSSSTVGFVKYNASNNPTEIDIYGWNFNFTFNNNSGIYNLKSNSLPLLYISIYSSIYETINYSWFYTTKEINQFTLGTKGSLHTQVSRDSKNKIAQIDYLAEGTNELVFSSTIDYELRTVN